MVELSRQNRKAGHLSAMKTITQTMRFRQAVMEYSYQHGVTKAAIHYRLNRQSIYRWRKRYDGTLQSLADLSHRPHSHPNQHTPEEIKLILDMRRRNPNIGTWYSGSSYGIKGIQVLLRTVPLRLLGLRLFPLFLNSYPVLKRST